MRVGAHESKIKCFTIAHRYIGESSQCSLLQQGVNLEGAQQALCFFVVLYPILYQNG